MLDIKSFAEFKNELKNNPDLQNDFKTDPVKAVDKVSTASNIVPNTLIYQIVVGSLGLAIILVIIGTVILTINNNAAEKNVPTILTAIASGAIGALAGLLAPTPTRRSD
jgi:hypothetical protein